jgi:hypothetical protein
MTGCGSEHDQPGQTRFVVTLSFLKFNTWG